MSEEDIEQLKLQVPLNEQGKLTSAGSINHPTACSPCLFVHGAVGCQRGLMCNFCHFVHTRKHKLMPSRVKRDRYRQLVTFMKQASSEKGKGAT
jgi:hypothetical protein